MSNALTCALLHSRRICMLLTVHLHFTQMIPGVIRILLRIQTNVSVYRFDNAILIVQKTNKKRDYVSVCLDGATTIQTTSENISFRYKVFETTY